MGVIPPVIGVIFPVTHLQGHFVFLITPFITIPGTHLACILLNTSYIGKNPDFDLERLLIKAATTFKCCALDRLKNEKNSVCFCLSDETRKLLFSNDLN